MTMLPLLLLILLLLMCLRPLPSLDEVRCHHGQRGVGEEAVGGRKALVEGSDGPPEVRPRDGQRTGGAKG